MTEEDLNDEIIRSAYGGMSALELRCPVVLCVAVEECSKNDNIVKLHRYRQVSGNLNLGFQQGILRDNSKWIIEVCRDAVMMVRPDILSKKPVRLSSKTKKKLCEVHPASAMYTFKVGTGIVRIGY